MSRRRLKGSLSTSLGIFVLLCAGRAGAQCTMDTDCKGDRICENGSCVAPSVAATPAPASAPQATPVPAPAGPVSATPSPSPAPSSPPHEAPSPSKVRHSKGMMVGGIVMVSLAPVGLAVAMLAALSKTLCSGVGPGYSDSRTAGCSDADPYIYGGLFSALMLTGVGIPMIVIGAHKEPASPTATVSPWVARQSAGLSLQLSL